MSKKVIGVSLAVALMMAAVAVPVVKAADKGPAEMTLDYNHKSKHVANFPHHKHQESYPCKECHHKDDAAPKPCHTCHGDNADGAKPAMKDAYHKNCKDDCHKAKKGPTKCGDCHDRK